MKIFPTFEKAIEDASYRLQHQAYMVKTGTWQGIDVSSKPEMETYELLNWDFSTQMLREDLPYYQEQIKPSLPWADQHFELERVSGQPLNPGTTWRDWPYGHSANRFRDEGDQFNHTYAERYWPKHAGMTKNGKLGCIPQKTHYGIRYEYGDLNDVIRQLNYDPNTRQAYLPVWFPEDGSHFGRKPCSIGYHFIQRNGYLHINYQLRSCDFLRHFRDDIYLTARLNLWVLSELRKLNKSWDTIKPGMFSMWITSLHVFLGDKKQLGWVE
jgi:hypothetical protein